MLGFFFSLAFLVVCCFVVVCCVVGVVVFWGCIFGGAFLCDGGVGWGGVVVGGGCLSVVIF